MLFDFLKSDEWKKKQEPDYEHWRIIPLLQLDNEGYGYAINRKGEILRLGDKSIMKPYPYPEELGGARVCIAVDKFFCYIDGPALADVIFDTPGSDAGRHCMFFTGYRYITK
jgi:hypothetical protein